MRFKGFCEFKISIFQSILLLTVSLVIQETKAVYLSEDVGVSLGKGAGARGEYYTSLVGIQQLARKEQDVLKKLLEYKEKLEDKIDYIDFFLDDYGETIHSIVQRSKRLRDKYGKVTHPYFQDASDLDYVVEKTSANPLMVYKLMRRFTREFSDIADLLEKDNSDEEFRQYIKSFPGPPGHKWKLPNENDLKGAADGLLRLQETYRLSTKDIGNGKLTHKQTRCKLTAFDMHFVGLYAFADEMYAQAIEWVYYAYQKVLEGDDTMPEANVRENLDLMSKYHNSEFLKFVRDPMDLFNGLIHTNFTNIPYLFIPPFRKDNPLGINENTIYDVFNFHALCRGEKLLPQEKSNELRCWRSSGHSAFHILNPFKIEMHYKKPPVIQVYDLISDSVINELKRKAIPLLKRAEVISPDKKIVVNQETLGGNPSDTRTSSIAWIHDTDENRDGILTKIPKVLERLTGLDVRPYNASEYLQTSCYGSVGGYYTPHLDALVDTDIPLEERLPDFRKRGDRIATVMFYLTDVELGGGTAFPKIGIAAKAVKGSAVMWYNLKYDGEKENLMMHGGCPVLYGNKWVANKWIRYFHQIHSRNCMKENYESFDK